MQRRIDITTDATGNVTGQRRREALSARPLAPTRSVDQPPPPNVPRGRTPAVDRTIRLVCIDPTAQLLRDVPDARDTAPTIPQVFPIILKIQPGLSDRDVIQALEWLIERLDGDSP